MQPPPRKGGSCVKFVKNLHAEQVAKLQVKNQTECELLEDLRSFIVKKSALEKSFCEALLKITSVYLNKKITNNIPDLKSEGSEERWNMWSVWRTVLEENEKLSKARMAAMEVMMQQIADDCKVLRLHKLQQTKKCVDLLTVMQKEVQNSVQEVDKTKKVYFDEEHSAHDVRDKAKDIEARLKRKKGSFFQSLSTLQKSSAKVSLKRELMEDKSAGARNDYLLALATANAHQRRYFVHDLQQIIQSMESSVYDKVQQYFSLIGRAELITCSAQQASYSKIRDQGQRLSREYNLQCLYLYYPVLKQHVEYEFERCDDDSIDFITLATPAGTGSTTGTAIICGAGALDEQCRHWMNMLIEQTNTIKNSRRQLRRLQALRQAGQKVDTEDQNGPTVDLDTKIDELLEVIRKAEVAKIKTEAKLDLLKKSQDENVAELYRKMDEELGLEETCAANMAADDEEEQRQQQQHQQQQQQQSNDEIKDDRRASNVANKGRAAGDWFSSSSSSEDMAAAGTSAAVVPSTSAFQGTTSGFHPENTAAAGIDVLKQLEASWQETEEEEESVTATTADNDSQSNNQLTTDAAAHDNLIYPSYEEEFETPFKCIVLYNYNAENADELSIVAQEELEIVGEGDGDGWLKARNASGQVGLVPCTYLDYGSIGMEEEQQEPGVVTSSQDSTSTAGSRMPMVSQISFSSVDYTVREPSMPTPAAAAVTSSALSPYGEEEDEDEEELFSTIVDEGDVWPSPDRRQVDDASSIITIQELATSSTTEEWSAMNGPKSSEEGSDGNVTSTKKGEEEEEEEGEEDGSSWCIAMYSFKAQNEDELSLDEGQLVEILDRMVHGDIDDGWWRGRKSTGVGEEKQVGLFPSLLVAQCDRYGRIIPVSPVISESPPPFACPEYSAEFGTEEEFASRFPHSPSPPLHTPPELPPHYVLEELTNSQHCLNDKEDTATPSETDLGGTGTSIPVLQQPDEQRDKMAVDDRKNGQVLTTMLPSFVVVTEEDDEKECRDDDDTEEINRTAADSLGVTQIVITAATPTADMANKSFHLGTDIHSQDGEDGRADPPEPAPSDEHEDMCGSLGMAAAAAAAALERRKSAGEINEAEPPPLYEPTITDLSDYPTTIIEEPELEEQEEEEDDEDDEEEQQYQHAQAGHHQAMAASTHYYTRVPPAAPAPQVPEHLEPDQLQKLQQLKESSA